ncbi:LysR family transcriptional regulator [Rhizobium sp. NZLR1b]|nr:LysR family transcriptional regulator [Rhizobium sp. NZLR1b]MBX5189207.1 LysR family transcriptional regulator [Rhizobium sp. NZLR3b]
MRMISETELMNGAGQHPGPRGISRRREEARLGLRLLTRTTRSVAPTEAGERLLRTVGPYVDGIKHELDALSELRDKPSGKVRLTSDENAAESILWPTIHRLLPEYPDIEVEVVVDYGLSDIVAEQYDAGVRSGGYIAKDMIAVRIGPGMRMVVVASPTYLESRELPLDPKDLTSHDCINHRLPTYGGVYPWEFRKDGREVNVRVKGQLVFNTAHMILHAVLAGHGLAYMPEQMVVQHIQNGQLVLLLDDWSPTYSGYHIYYPSKRQVTPAFQAVIKALRYPQRHSFAVD